jgi:hypothetical protein
MHWGVFGQRQAGLALHQFCHGYLCAVESSSILICTYVLKTDSEVYRRRDVIEKYV